MTLRFQESGCHLSAQGQFQEFLISEYSTQFLTVTFEYSEENKLARIFRETTSVGNHLMYEFVYDETEENHGELDMIIQYKPHHEESCQGSVYPLYYVVEELSESNASFTCLRYDEEETLSVKSLTSFLMSLTEISLRSMRSNIIIQIQPYLLLFTMPTKILRLLIWFLPKLIQG